MGADSLAESGRESWESRKGLGLGDRQPDNCKEDYTSVTKDQLSVHTFLEPDKRRPQRWVTKRPGCLQSEMLIRYPGFSNHANCGRHEHTILQNPHTDLWQITLMRTPARSEHSPSRASAKVAPCVADSYHREHVHSCEQRSLRHGTGGRVLSIAYRCTAFTTQAGLLPSKTHR